MQFRAETEFKVKSENEESDQETEMLSNGQHKAEKVSNTKLQHVCVNVHAISFLHSKNTVTRPSDEFFSCLQFHASEMTDRFSSVLCCFVQFRDVVGMTQGTETVAVALGRTSKLRQA